MRKCLSPEFTVCYSANVFPSHNLRINFFTLVKKIHQASVKTFLQMFLEKNEMRYFKTGIKTGQWKLRRSRRGVAEWETWSKGEKWSRWGSGRKILWRRGKTIRTICFTTFWKAPRPAVLIVDKDSMSSILSIKPCVDDREVEWKRLHSPSWMLPNASAATADEKRGCAPPRSLPFPHLEMMDDSQHPPPHTPTQPPKIRPLCFKDRCPFQHVPRRPT